MPKKGSTSSLTFRTLVLLSFPVTFMVFTPIGCGLACEYFQAGDFLATGICFSSALLFILFLFVSYSVLEAHRELKEELDAEKGQE